MSDDTELDKLNVRWGRVNGLIEAAGIVERWGDEARARYGVETPAELLRAMAREGWTAADSEARMRLRQGTDPVVAPAASAPRPH